MMNSIMQNVYPIFRMYQALRNQMMDLLSDEELNFRPGGDNPPLGAICREIGEVEHAYIESFRTFTQNFDYRLDDPATAHSVSKLQAWYARLDAELEETVTALSEDEIQNKEIDRGGGFTISPRIQLEIYKEALLIFYGKSSVYLKAMHKDLPEQWRAWIG